MAYRAGNEQKHDFAKAIQAVQIKRIKTGFNRSDRVLSLNDSVRPYIYVLVVIEIVSRQGTTQSIRIEPKTKEREVYYHLAQAYNSSIMPSSFKIKAVREAFAQLMLKLNESIRDAKDKYQTEKVIQFLNRDFRKRLKIQNQREYDWSKEELFKLFSGGFRNITEDQLLELYREHKIRSVMEA